MIGKSHKLIRRRFAAFWLSCQILLNEPKQTRRHQDEVIAYTTLILPGGFWRFSLQISIYGWFRDKYLEIAELNVPKESKPLFNNRIVLPWKALKDIIWRHENIMCSQNNIYMKTPTKIKNFDVGNSGWGAIYANNEAVYLFTLEENNFQYTLRK